MLLDAIKKGDTDYSCTIRIVDDTDGTPETGVVFNTAGIDLWYRRPGAAHSSITEATQTEGGAHTDGGFVHISDGCYRLDLPDAAVASGVDYVDVGGTVTGMVVIGGRIRLTDFDLDTANVTLAAATHTGAVIPTVTTLTGHTAQTGDSFALIGTAGAGLTDITINAASVDAIWDEVLTGGTHNVVNSAGRRLRQIDAAFEVHNGTAQAGAAGTITLDTGASATDDIYRGNRIVITEGTGAQEHGICISYNGTTKVATMAENWVITPDATSVFEVIPADADIETWQHNVVAASASGLPDVNVNEVGDTSQTAGDLAALIATVDTNVDSILVDTADMQPRVVAIETDTSTTLETHLTDIKGGTFSGATDSLEAIRDRGDAAWTTGAGGTPPQLLQSTTIATLATQTSFTLTAGSADDDAYNGAIAVVTDSATSTQKAVGTVSDYTGATRTVTLSADPAIFTMAVGDTIEIIAALGSAGTAPTVTQIRQEIDTNSTQLAAIVADTNELQTDDVPGLIATAQADLDIITGTDGATISSASETSMVDANWNEPIAGHLTAGTTGLSEALGGAAIVDTTITGTPTTTTFVLAAGSAVDDFYNDQTAYILSGTGIGQSRVVLDYDGTTKTVTIDEAFAVTPIATDRVVILIEHVHPITQIAHQIWDDDLSAHTTAGSAGKAVQDIETDTGTTLPATLATLATATALSTVDANVDAILVDTGTTLPATLAALNDLSITDVLTTQMTEAYAADGTAPTLAQCLFMIQQTIGEFSISGTTITAKQLDGTTTAATFTLDDASTPTSRTRAT